MKLDKNALDCIQNKFNKIPNVNKTEFVTETDSGFIVNVIMEDGYNFTLNVFCYNKVYPYVITNMLKAIDDVSHSVIVCPYLSPRSTQICEENGLGYFDFAGNCWFAGHSIYLSEKGNINPVPQKQNSISIFEKSSVISSLILRVLFADLKKRWKLKYLAEEVGCSIGQVSKVMNYLIDNSWAEKVEGGYIISNPNSLISEWSKIYGKRKNTEYSCYTMDSISDFESKLQTCEIENYLTGFSGGVRYTPVVRYNKVHLYVKPQCINQIIHQLNLKEVDSGSNVSIISLDNDAIIADSRNINNSSVVSPVQIYLDCMQISGRGEEMANEILRKEILGDKR